MSEYTLILAFAAGLFGGAHCIGMCGGLVSACFLKLGPDAARPAAWIAYHGARVFVYTVAGGIAGALGLLVSAGELGLVQAVLMMGAGILMILLGLDFLGLLGGLHGIRLRTLPAAWVGRVLALGNRQGVLAGAGMLGMVNGLMPCPLTLAVAVQAMATANAASGAALMLAFGLGTMPAMLALSAAVSRLGLRMRGWFVRMAGVLIIVLGAVTLQQGLSFFEVLQGLVRG